MATDVHLTRTCASVPWGFSLAGGVEYGAPITVVKVIPHSLAFEGDMCDGDIVMEINGVPASNLTQEQLRSVVLDSGNILGLRLLPRRSGTPLPLEFTSSVISFEPDDPMKEVPIQRPASPFVQKQKQYRPFSTAPIEGLPPLEHPIILSPNYKDDFTHIKVKDYEIDSIFKLRKSSKYDETSIRLDSFVTTTKTYEELYKAIEMSTTDIINETYNNEIERKDVQKMEATASEVVNESIESATQRICENGNVSMLAKLIDETTDEICKKFSINETNLEESTTVCDSYAMTPTQSSQESYVKEQTVEAYSVNNNTNRNTVSSNESQILLETQNCASESFNIEKQLNSSSEIVQQQNISTEIIHQESLSTEIVSNNKSHSETEKQKSQEFKSTQTVETKNDFDEQEKSLNRKEVLDNIKTVSERMEHVESSSTELNAIKKQALNTANMLTEQNTYRSLTMPGVQGTTHSSQHYDLLLKTFFIHLTDVMVALSRLISSDHPITRASTPAPYEQKTFTRTETVHEKTNAMSYQQSQEGTQFNQEKITNNVKTVTPKSVATETTEKEINFQKQVENAMQSKHVTAEMLTENKHDDLSSKEKVISQFTAMKSKEMTENIAAITSELGKKLEKLHIEDSETHIQETSQNYEDKKIMYVATVVDVHTDVNENLAKMIQEESMKSESINHQTISESIAEELTQKSYYTLEESVEKSEFNSIKTESEEQEAFKFEQSSECVEMINNNIVKNECGKSTEAISTTNAVEKRPNDLVGEKKTSIFKFETQPSLVSGSPSAATTPLTPPTPLTDEYVFRLQFQIDESKVDPHFNEMLMHDDPNIVKKPKLIPYYESSIGPFIPAFDINSFNDKIQPRRLSSAYQNRLLTNGDMEKGGVVSIISGIDGAKGIKIIGGIANMNNCVEISSHENQENGIEIVSGITNREGGKAMKIISGITNVNKNEIPIESFNNKRRVSKQDVYAKSSMNEVEDMTAENTENVKIISGVSNREGTKGIKIISGIANVNKIDKPAEAQFTIRRNSKQDTKVSQTNRESQMSTGDNVTILSGITSREGAQGIKVISGIASVNRDAQFTVRRKSVQGSESNRGQNEIQRRSSDANNVSVISGIANQKGNEGLKIISGITKLKANTISPQIDQKYIESVNLTQRNDKGVIDVSDKVNAKHTEGEIISSVSSVQLDKNIIDTTEALVLKSVAGCKSNKINETTMERVLRTEFKSFENTSNSFSESKVAKTETYNILSNGFKATSESLDTKASVQTDNAESFINRTEINQTPPLPSGYRTVKFDVSSQNVNETRSVTFDNTVRVVHNGASASVKNVGGTVQGIMYGLESPFNEEDLDKEMGKPGLSDEKIAELISGEAEMLKEAHVIGLRRVLNRHMHKASEDDDDSSVNFKKLKPQIEALKDSEVLKALNEEILKTREEKKKEERKWTTFLQKPSRPVPGGRFGRFASEPVTPFTGYKVQIVKQPKPKVAPDYKPKDFETGLLPWEFRAANEPPPPEVPPEDPILIPEEPPEFLEALDNLPESEVPDLEDTGISLPPPQTELPYQEIRPNFEEELEYDRKEEGIQVEDSAEELERIEEEQDEMEQNRIAAQVLSNLHNMVDPSAPMEDQLQQMQAQLAVLATLPAAIHQTLEMVTKQLGTLSTQKRCREIQETQECVEVTETKTVETTEYFSQEASVQEVTDVESCQVAKTGDVPRSVAEEISQAQIKIDIEEIERMKKEEETMRIIEQQKRELMAQLQQEHVQKQLKQRPTPQPKPKPVFGPLTPQERPQVLPGGRKWRNEKDAYNEDFIRDTLTAQAELIQGKTKGIHFESHRLPYDNRVNFLKYQKPPISLDHLKDSDVYKMVHHMDDETQLRGIDQIRPYVISECDFREKCRSMTPNFDTMAPRAQFQP